MANNVHYSMNFDLDDGQVELLRGTMFLVEQTNGNGYKEWTAEELPIYPEKYDNEGWYDWGCRNMGAKWCHIEDYEDNYLTGYSAWSPCNPMFEHLGQYIFDQVGGDVSGTLTYEDEFRNYIGKTTLYTDEGQVYLDVNEVDGEELNEIILEAFGQEESWFQSDEFDWWNEYEIKKGTYAGEKWEPQQYVDEVVYEFFDSEKLGVL